MEVNLYTLIAVLGIIFIILGTSLVSSKKSIRRRYTYPFLILGGILLEIYSISIKDPIFIVLQGIFILSSIIGLIKINEHRRKK